MYYKHCSGNTRDLTDGQGNLVQEYFYDVYGTYWNVKKDPVNPWKYVGGYGVSADADDGLLYMRARHQDPGLGVFISRDPIGLRDGLNLYGYVNNNPVKFADATGKYAVIPIAAGAGIVISCIAAKADEMALAVVLYFSDEDVRRDVDGIRERAEMATRGMYAWENADRNKANFMPHCVALCEVSRIYGSAFARTGGLWNEVSGATGVSWTDLKNNEIGISIGVTASSFKNCIKKCKDAAEAGKAVAMVD